MKVKYAIELLKTYNENEEVIMQWYDSGFVEDIFEASNIELTNDLWLEIVEGVYKYNYFMDTDTINEVAYNVVDKYQGGAIDE